MLQSPTAQHELPGLNLLTAVSGDCGRRRGGGQPFSSLGKQPGLADVEKGTLFEQIVRVVRCRRRGAYPWLAS